MGAVGGGGGMGWGGRGPPRWHLPMAALAVPSVLWCWKGAAPRAVSLAPFCGSVIRDIPVRPKPSSPPPGGHPSMWPHSFIFRGAEPDPVPSRQRDVTGDTQRCGGRGTQRCLSPQPPPTQTSPQAPHPPGVRALLMGFRWSLRVEMLKTERLFLMSWEKSHLGPARRGARPGQRTATGLCALWGRKWGAGGGCGARGPTGAI